MVEAGRAEGDDTDLPLSSALVIVLDGSGDAVEVVACGIPFHVTLLSPFAPRDELTDQLLSETRAFFAARRPFEFVLTRIAAWPRVVYAVPEPSADTSASCGGR